MQTMMIDKTVRYSRAPGSRQEGACNLCEEYSDADMVLIQKYPKGSGKDVSKIFVCLGCAAIMGKLVHETGDANQVSMHFRIFQGSTEFYSSEFKKRIPGDDH